MAFIHRRDLPAAAYTLSILTLRLLPVRLRLKLLNGLAARLSGVWYRIDRQGAAMTRENIRLVMGWRLPADRLEATARATFQAIVRGKLLNDMTGNLSLKGLRRYLTVEGLEHVDAALRQGKGVVLIGAHFGSHGYSPMILLQRLGYSLAAVVTPEVHKHDSWFMRRIVGPIRNRAGQELTVIDPDGSPKREMPDVLRRNAVLVIYGDVLDKDLLRLSAPNVLPAPLLGHSLPLKTGAFRLARWTGSPMLPFFIVPQGERLCISIEAPLELSADNSVAGLAADLAAYTARFEPHLLRHPELWAHWRRRRNSLPTLMKLTPEPASN